eukprot:86488-Pelagomonas_calceolata.AAC.1
MWSCSDARNGPGTPVLSCTHAAQQLCKGWPASTFMCHRAHLHASPGQSQSLEAVCAVEQVQTTSYDECKPHDKSETHRMRRKGVLTLV